MGTTRKSGNLNGAKNALDVVIKKSRVHLYKPIQIAEILYYHRTKPQKNINLLDLETYRNPSKKWRDIICMQFLGRVSTSSARFQDNLFTENAIPPHTLELLGNENKKNGIVEAYIYKAFENKYLQLDNALSYCLNSNIETFDVEVFLEQFWEQAGLKRSLDKIFEIVVYALFEVLITAMGVKIDIYHNQSNTGVLDEFSTFAEKILNFTTSNNRKTLGTHFNRVGVTNAADRGLDMYANFGSVVQIKHLSLDENLAEDIVTSITSDEIIIVCKDSKEAVINSLSTQIGWRSRIQAVITVDELISWYKKALKGKFSNILGEKIISTLAQEIKTEFPLIASNDFQTFKKQRGYHQLNSKFWSIST